MAAILRNDSLIALYCQAFGTKKSVVTKFKFFLNFKLDIIKN